MMVGRSSISMMMKRFDCIGLLLLAMFWCGPSYGAQKTIRWENGAFCEFETRFDPAKVDEERLRNTINVIFGDDKFYRYVSPRITSDGPNGRPRTNTTEFERTCKVTKEKAASLPVLELPGIEEFRRLKIEELEDHCWFDTLESRAASGEPAALREYTPSAAKCSHFIDALEGKTDLRAVWRDTIESQCRMNARPEECRIDAQRGQSDPDADELKRSYVLGFGWNNCSTRYLKMNEWADKAESMRKAIETNFRRRFKVKAFPCAD